MSEQETESEKFHWLHGLEEYIDYIDHPAKEKFSEIKRAIMHGNIWKIKHLMIREVHRGPIDYTDDFINVILSYYLNYENINSRKILQYIAHSIDDEYIKAISRWSIRWQGKANLIEHFSRGQVKSKMWMLSELEKVFPNKQIGTIAHYGGWYATVAYLFFDLFNIKNYYNLEADFDCIKIADDFNAKYTHKDWQFKSAGIDVNDLWWNDQGFTIKCMNDLGELHPVWVNPDLIINTSCEHMNEDWFEAIPKDKMICLQTNDYFENAQHHNCCKDLDHALKKYPVSELLYSGEIDTQLYKRFMIIGHK
tara:strand:- start:1166 stop:2089 length:924 start_codon:yes stop_codon:yes gene_type:complete